MSCWFTHPLPLRGGEKALQGDCLNFDLLDFHDSLDWGGFDFWERGCLKRGIRVQGLRGCFLVGLKLTGFTVRSLCNRIKVHFGKKGKQQKLAFKEVSRCLGIKGGGRR